MDGSDCMSNNTYQCCFCGETIKSNNFDITSLVLTTNWGKDLNLQQEQQLFCHLKCLKEKVNKNVPIYLDDLKDA